MKTERNEKQNTSLRFYKMGEASKTKLKIVSGAELAFGWNRFNLRPIGLWPDQTSKKTHRNLLMKYCPPMWSMWVFTFVVVPQALAPIAYTFVLGELIELISAVAGYTAAIVRIMVLWHNSEVLAKCLSFVTEDWRRNLSMVERATMIRNAELGKNISIGVTIFVQCLVWSYVILRAFSLLYLNIDNQNATELGKQLFYPGYCPFDLSVRSNFAIVWCGQCIGLLCAAFAYSGTDGFVAMLIIHLCGQITILRYALINLLNDDESLSSENFRVKLRVLIKRHRSLINIAKVIRDAVSFLLLVLILSYTLQLCCQLFRLMAAVTERKPGHFPFLQVFFYLSFLNATFVHLFVYCYVGDMLIEESEAVGLASYSCKWYILSSKNVHDIKFVMCRARMPLQIMAGNFVPFSLQLFSDILRTSMSYFSVLLTMKEQLAE